MKKYDSYKDSGVEWIGEIPNHWIPNKLKYLNDITKESISTDKIKLKPVIHYSIPNIQMFGTGVLENGEDIDSSKLLLFGGEVLISKLNPRKSTVCIVKYHEELIVGSGEFISFKPNSINDKYLFYNFINQRFTEFLDSSVESVTRSHQRVKPDLLYDTLLFIPPLKEQQQIVEFLDTKTSQIDTLIEKTQHKIELLKEQRTSLINHVVTKGLNPNVELKDSGIEWIGEIPKHWLCGKLKYHSNRIGDGLHSTPKYVDSSEYRFINGNNLIKGEIRYFDSTKCVSEEEYQKHYIDLDDKTILLSINGTIGNLSFYNGEKVILGKSSCYIKTVDSINKYFLYYLLDSESINKYFTSELTGTTIYNLSLNSIRNTPIPLPELEEQQQIVEYLDEQTNIIDTTITKEEKRIELLKEYRQSLISEVVTGKIKVI